MTMAPCDRLTAEIERLQALNEKQARMIDGYQEDEANAEREILQLRQIAGAQAKLIEKASTALDRYAQHTKTCGRFTTISGECTCGRDNAIRPVVLAAVDARRARLDAADVPAAKTSPIPLNSEQMQAAKEWAADDRLWTTQDTVEMNLRTFARVILKAATP